MLTILLVQDRGELGAQTLETILRIKGLDPQVQTPATSSPAAAGAKPTALLHTQKWVKGWWPVLEYLEDRFPFPPLLVGDPEQRSAIRSAAHQFLASDSDRATARQARVVGRGPFLLGRHPCLLDIMLRHIKNQSCEDLIQLYATLDEDEADELCAA